MRDLKKHFYKQNLKMLSNTVKLVSLNFSILTEKHSKSRECSNNRPQKTGRKVQNLRKVEHKKGVENLNFSKSRTGLKSRECSKNSGKCSKNSTGSKTSIFRKIDLKITARKRKILPY
nr:MAG TPA: hypothetical protein [Caudoviricetes sp.]